MKSNIWWNQTPGPLRMVNEIVSNLINGRTIWLDGKGLCWDDDRRRLIKDQISECDCRKNIEFINAEDEAKKPVYQTILDLDPAPRPIYYPSQKLEEYMIKNKVCDGSILWVYNLKDDEYSEEWLKASRLLASKKASTLIACEGSIWRGAHKNVEIIDPKIFISEFDVLHFVMTSVSEYSKNIQWKTYVSRLITEVLGYDVESCDLLIQDVNKLVSNPEAYCSDVIEGIDGCQLKGRVWNAQIKSIYPMIEQKRLELVYSNYCRLSTVVPFKDEWGYEFKTPEEIELRHMVHFYNTGELELSQPDSSELILLYNMRNDLSHLKIIDGETIWKFLM